ncbi:MAG: glycosyltransferase family 2 protein [Planctomycetaceae bacterium]|nr:glycosyltransferase family 2 protein [Planctomycetaceae bacterium]
MTAQLPVTAIVAVRNEAANISRCVQALQQAARIVVVDSDSTDDTALRAEAAGAEVVQFTYAGGYPKKRQWALKHLDIATDWVLLVDADELVPAALWDEIAAVIASSSPCSAYLVEKGFHFLGRRFRYGGFSHSAVSLFQRGVAHFEKLDLSEDSGLDMEVHERLVVDGPVGRLMTPLIHDDQKGLTAYLDRHNRYASWEAAARLRFLSTGRWGTESIEPRFWGNTQERRRFLKQIACRIPCEPTLWFLYHYIVRLGFLEGRRGWIASRIRAQYIANVRAKMYELRLQADSAAGTEAADGC